MKHSRTKLNKLIDELIEKRVQIEAGEDHARPTQEYLHRLSAILYKLIELSHEPDYKGRHSIYYDIRTYTTHENGRCDSPILKLPDDATPEQTERALETASVNVESAVAVLKDIARGMRYRREANGSCPCDKRAIRNNAS